MVVRFVSHAGRGLTKLETSGLPSRRPNTRLKTLSDDHYRTVEELSFAFSVLLARALPRQQAALLFQELWDEANEAAVACDTERAALTYVELLRDMDKRWRHMPALH